MKRVLFISPQPFFEWRGSPIRAGFDVQALAELGYDVDLLTLPLGRERTIPGVRVRRVPNVFMAKQVPIGPSLLKAAFDVLLLLKGLGLALKNRYDVIHGIEDGGAVGAIIAGITRTRLVFEKHSDPGSYRGGPARNFIMRLYARVERFTARHADAVIGTGPGLAEQIRKMGGRAPVHEIFDIPSSLTEARPERTAEIRRSLQQNERETLVAYVGSFAVYQGVDLMFEAMPEVIRRRPDARFVVIGGTPQEISDRKRWLAERGVETSASFIGKIPPDDLPDYLAASDILLSPRRAGVNTPLKLLDYMKAGRAIVATDVESNRLILNEHTAVLTEGTVSGFAAGIEKLVADAELRRKLGANGRRLIDEKYNFTEFKRKLKACYEAIVAEG